MVKEGFVVKGTFTSNITSTITINGSGTNGTVTCSHDDTSLTGENYYIGESITFTITPTNSNYEFEKFKVGEEEIDVSDTRIIKNTDQDGVITSYSYKTKMVSGLTVEAIWKSLISYNLTVTVSGYSGTIKYSVYNASDTNNAISKTDGVYKCSEKNIVIKIDKTYVDLASNQSNKKFSGIKIEETTYTYNYDDSGYYTFSYQFEDNVTSITAELVFEDRGY